MRFSLKPFFFNAALIALLLCSAPASAASFAYLYVEANEGNSSGGHSAIQFGDEIYHYQHHDSGLIRLLKQDKPEFHFQYRFLQNRRIHLSHVEISEETFTLLREHFKLQFLAQEQQFKQLHNLHKDRVFLLRLLHQQDTDEAKPDAQFSSVLGLKGSGLFYADHELDLRNKENGLKHVKAAPFQSPRIILNTAVEHSEIPFALSPSTALRRALSKGERDFGMLTKWANERKPFMLRQAQHERLPLSPTAVYKIMVMLRKKIEQNYGQDYLGHRREHIIALIKSLKPSHWYTVKPVLSKDNFPPAMNSFAESYEDFLLGLVAIKVLEEGHALRPDAFLVTHEPVTQEEKQVLEKFRDQLTSSLLKSVNSGRPDWGYAVIVNIARLLAVDRSLQLGLWVFIDDFAMDSEWVSADQFAQFTEQMQAQINDARTNLQQTRKALQDSGGLSEANYSKLEMSANRYFELLKGKQHKAIRFIGEKALPTKSINLPDWTVPDLTQQQLKAALNELDNYESQLFHELAAHYQYDLITRNCVTELFRAIDQALLQANKADVASSEQVEQLIKESTKRLGGNISAAYNFIPFVSFQSVQEHYKVTASAMLNSYRDQQLQKLYAQDDRLIVALRESNTFTSTLYAYNPDDAFFVFFTDDSLAFRPIFGLFNTAAGIGQSVFGFLSWPIDAGKNLKSGATGILMSLPELLFFNMRKGSYKYLSYNQFVKDEKPVY